jgi:hypothetical protein
MKADMMAGRTARWLARCLSGASAIAIGLAAGACDDGGGDGDDVPDPRQTVAELPAAPSRDLDLLFVIDDSNGMAEKQIVFASNLALLFDRLAAVPGGLPNLHIGVVSTDMGTKASDSPTPGPATGQIGQGGCSGFGKGGTLQLGVATEVTGRFVIDVEAAGGGRTRNYTGGLIDTVGQMLRLNGGGCGFEQPLAAMRASLDNHPMNTGFLRPEALLGVIFLADEDDCSAKSTQLWAPESPTLGPLQSFRCTQFGVTCAVGGQTPDEMKQAGAKGECGSNASSQIIDDVTQFRDFLVGLKGGDARRVVLGGSLGPPEPLAVELRVSPTGGAPGLAHACTYMVGSTRGDAVDPAARMRDLFSRFPDRERFTSICGPEHAPGVVQIAELLRRAIGTGCVEDRLVDTDPAAAGVQADCVVEDVVGEGETAKVTRIEACEAKPEARPCWLLEQDLARCAAAPAPHLGLVVERDEPAVPGAVTRVRCLAER